MNNPLSVLLVLGIGVVGGYAAGYSKAREKFCEAMVMALYKDKEENKNE